MNWTIIIVLVLLVGFIINETIGPRLHEGFANPRRSDIGLSTDGWTEAGGFKRDLRYKEAFVDIQGLGVATDFCRAVKKQSDPDSLHIACALGQRDGMNTMEYNSRTKGEGFRFSRDDYWTINPKTKRSDYCRIVKDDNTEEWITECAVTGRNGFQKQEERDTSPPPAIQELLEAYQGILVWFRWRDDEEDYAKNAEFSIFGVPIFPSLLNPEVSRGLQLNRWPVARQEAGEEAPPIRDYLCWGEKDTLELNQTISPRQIRAISCWVWWDAFEKGATIVECLNPSKAVGNKDRIALGVEGGGPDLAPATLTKAATELRPELIQAIGQLTEPALLTRPHKPSPSATYYFEIWDEEQRIMRLSAPMGSAKVGEWQHVAVTVTDGAAWWPTWQIWINGSLEGEKVDGRLSPAMEITENYIGKNLRGCIQDLRIYGTPMPPRKLKAAMEFSKKKLHPLP